MLQNIRDKTSGWIAYVIIGLISIPFALWGINSYLGGGEQQPAAIVNGTEISQQQLDFSYARYRERLASIFGGTLPAAFDDEVALKEQALTQVIEEQVLRSYVEDKGFRVGDQALFENIRAIDAFQQGGNFSKDQYVNQLASQGYQPAGFEQELRSTIEMQQLNQAVRATAFTLPRQLKAYNQLKNQQRKLRVMTVENNAQELTVSDTEVEEFYNQQGDRYMDPAMVKVDYIELSIDNVKETIELTEDAIQQRYELLVDQLTTPEIRTASHILITVDNDATDEEVDQAKQKILGLKSRVADGEDFAELAKEYSEDPGSAEEGGDLGEIEKGMMVKAFETALFGLNADQVSDPVKTQFGWHLIKLHEVSGGETQTLEEARETLELEMKTELAELQIYDLVESLANLGYEQPDSLLPVSEQLGLTIQTTDWFSRSLGEGIAGQDKFRQVAFSDDVIKQNRNSEVIELSDNRVVIMRLNTHKPATRKSLESVSDSIVNTIKTNKGRELAQEKGKELLADLMQGTSLDEVADKTAISVIDAGYVSRSSTALDPQVVNSAFSLPKPENDKPVFEGVTEVDGDFSIIEFTGVRVDSGNDADSSAEDTVKALTSAAADYDFQAFVKSLTEQADIVRTPVTELE